MSLEIVIEDEGRFLTVVVEDNPHPTALISLSGEEDNQLVRNEDGYYVPPVEWGDIRNGTTSSAIQVDEAVEQTTILSSQVEVLEGIAEEHTTQIASLEQSKVDDTTYSEFVEDTLSALSTKVEDTDLRLTNSRTPTGPAGGVLSGTYPNPTFSVDMATQWELDQAILTRTTPQQAADAAPVQSVQGRTGDVVITAEDVGMGNVDNTSDADKPVSTAQQAALDGKVDKVAGMGLSSNDFTDPLRDKLMGLEGTHWRGTFVSLAALQAGVTDPQAGDYADVDIVGDDVVRYIWDATDGIWVAQSGEVAPITASQVKLLYESNPDTNAFTDADEAKLDGIEAGATVGDAVLRQDLADPAKGAAIVARGVVAAESITDLSSLPLALRLEDRLYAVGDTISGIFRWVSDDLSGSVADGNRQAFIPADGTTLASGGWVRLSGSINAAVTILVGDGLYFDTINKALDLVSGWQMGGEGRVRIILASGYVMREQIVLHRGRDLSFVEITAEDDEVIVDREFINIPTPGGIILVNGDFQAFGPALFAATEQAKLPVIGAKFRFNTSGSGSGGRVGIRVAYGASVVVRRGCGVLDSPTEGLTAIHGAHAIAAGANFSGAGSNGVTSYRGSFVDFRDGVADNAGLRGAYVGSNSRLEALNSSFKNAAEWGVEAYGASIAHVRNTDVSGAGRDGFYARDGAVISSRDPIINDVVRHGIHTENGGRVYASGASILRAGQRAVSAFDGGYVNVQGATIEDCGGDALYANRLSEIQADEVKIKRAGAITISCDRASTVNAAGSVIEDSTGLTISCRRSGRVAADSSTILMNGPKDLALVREGGEVSLTSATVSTAFATAIRATTKSGIAAAGLKVNGAGSASFYASAASTLDLDGAQFTTTGLTYVQSSRGSVANVDGATSSNGISLVVARGGVIAASSAVASTNVTTNAIHPEGVIYQDTQPEPEPEPD